MLATVKSIWPSDISIQFPQTNNISNELNCPVDELIIWKNNDLTHQYLKTLTEKERDEIAKDLLNFFIVYNWDHLIFVNKSIDKTWKSLQNSNVKISKNNGSIVLANSSSVGNNIYKTFFPNILKIQSKKKISVYDALKNKEILWKIIRNRIGNTLLYNTKNRTPRQWPMTIRPSMIIQGAKCSGQASIGSIFKPAIAKVIYDSYVKDNDNVYDYSAGFGGRLLGLMATQKKGIKYFACEPNTETYDGLISMVKHFGFNADIRKMGSENLIFNEKMDFVFSSPPYFNKETYTNEQSQCYNKFPIYDEWIEKYWRVTVTNIKTMLNNNGVFAVNIGNGSNKFMKQISEDFQRVILDEGFVQKNIWYMQTSKSHLSNKKNKAVVTKLEGIYFYGIK